MDAASIAALTLINLKSNQRKHHRSKAILTSPWPSASPNVAAPYSPDSNRRRNSLSLTRCSTKPDTNKDNAKNQDSIAQPDSVEKLPRPVSSGAISSSLTSLTSSPSLSSRGLVFDLGHKTAWDSREIGSPVVKRFLSDDEERWYMWYHGNSGGNPGSDSIGLAVSGNGVHWERGGEAVSSSRDVGLVMKCSKDWWAFDTMSVRPSEVVIMSSNRVRASSAVYWLYYTGYSPETVKISDNSLEFDLQNPERRSQIDGSNDESQNLVINKTFSSLPGLAISQDGRHWARIEGEHHSGALFDLGAEGEWDSLFIAGPQVVYHGNGDLRMYYHSFDVEQKQFGIGIARSRDGMKWVKLGKIIGGGKVGAFDELGALNACVLKRRREGEQYIMAYEGVDANGERSIGMAISPDGLREWRRLEENEGVLRRSVRGCWDDEGVGSPCLVEMDGEDDGLRLYYAGYGNGGRTGIGLAVSDGIAIRSFRRWSGFHL